MFILRRRKKKPEPVIIKLDGKAIHEALLRLKRQNGTDSLGL